MKKKENSLLSKLKQENQANSKSLNILSDIEDLIPKLKTDTILTNKIEEIKKMQLENRLDSSNKIFSILNEQFNYSYPFHYKLNYNEQPVLSNSTFNKTLFDHIKNEANFNSTKEMFNEKVKLNNERIELEKILKENSSYAIDTLKVFGTLAVLLLIINIFGNTSVQKITAYLLFSTPLFFILMIIYEYSKRQSKKGRVKYLKEKNEKYLIELKTKANTV